MRKVMVMVLCLSLVAGAALAREAVLTRVDLGDLVDMGLRSDDPNCVRGNLSTDIFGYYDAWYYGFEDYAFMIRHLQNAPCLCTEGWALRNVTMVLALDVDTDILVQPVLYANDAGKPGAVIYSGPTYNITGIPQLGYYNITLPFDGAEACQVPATGTYFLGFSFLDDGPVFGLPITSGPLTGHNFNNWGTGWKDLVVEHSFQGNIMIFAEVDCCWGQVQTEDSSLSEIKQLFR